MRSNPGCPVDQIGGGLDLLASADVAGLPDQTLRGQLVELLVLGNRLHAELVRRVDVFDRRGLAEPDGFRTTTSWLQAVGRLPGHLAGRLVKTARLLRRLPKLATLAQSGAASQEHVNQVLRLAHQVGVEPVVEVEQTLADASSALDVPRFALVCARLAAHLDPDGPDPGRDFARRGLTLAAVHGMMLLRGQLDAEGGAAVAAALDALMTPPGDGDDRGPGQRRADALVELARRQLSSGVLPMVARHRPQVAVLVHPQALSPDTLATLAERHREDAAGRRLRELVTAGHSGRPAALADWTRPGVPIGPGEHAPLMLGRTSEDLRRALAQASGGPGGRRAPGRPPPQPGAPPQTGGAPPQAGAPPPTGNPPPQAGAPRAGTPRAGASPPTWAAPGWADPPWLDWIGPISPEVAQRIACDADIWRVILDPATGMPLDVGRGHRLVPHWIRKALHARDRGCRWTGCTTPVQWTDAHHLRPWADGGQTTADQCLLLCRYHHGLVHEGGWRVDLDAGTGEVRITRPDGVPHRITGTRSISWTGPTTHTP
jgi:hypothetical protein